MIQKLLEVTPVFHVLFNKICSIERQVEMMQNSFHYFKEQENVTKKREEAMSKQQRCCQLLR
jgi:hypothetical protein